MVTQSSMIGCSTPTWRNHFGSEILFWAWVSGFNSKLVRTFSYQSQEKSVSIVVSNVLFLNIDHLSFSDVEKTRYLPVCKLKSSLHHHHHQYLPHKEEGCVEVEVMPQKKLDYYISLVYVCCFLPASSDRKHHCTPCEVWAYSIISTSHSHPCFITSHIKHKWLSQTGDTVHFYTHVQNLT